MDADLLIPQILSLHCIQFIVLDVVSKNANKTVTVLEDSADR